jgi:peroxiredoxin
MLKLFLMIIFLTIISGCLENENLIEWGNAPIFNLTTIEGDVFNLSDNHGKIILVDFMFVNCPPCQLQMDELNKLYDNFNEKIVMISISVLGAGDTNTDLKNFKELYEAKWTFALDTYNEDATFKYNVLTVPKIIIINKNGDIAYTHNGFIKSNILIEEINKII